MNPQVQTLVGPGRSYTGEAPLSGVFWQCHCQKHFDRVASPVAYGFTLSVDTRLVRARLTLNSMECAARLSMQRTITYFGLFSCAGAVCEKEEVLVISCPGGDEAVTRLF